MAFGLLYMLLALVSKAGSDIKYGIVSANDRHNARERGSDTYIDGRGITRTVSGNKAVSTYRNDRGEAILLDKNNTIVKVYNKKIEDNYSIITVKNCLDKYRNQEYCNNIPRHKNCRFDGIKLQDIETGKYLTLRKIRLEDKYEWLGKGRNKERINKGREHLFYVDPLTLDIVRESDGEAELRRKGYEKIPSKKEIDNFIIKYNNEQKEMYEPNDVCTVNCYGLRDIPMDWINKWIWKQNKEKEKLS